jgi:hypothetical protein
MKFVSVQARWGLLLAVCVVWSAWTAGEYAFLAEPRDPYFALGVGVLLFVGNLPLLGLVVRRKFGPRVFWKAFEVFSYFVFAMGAVGFIGGALSEGAAAPIEFIRPGVELLLVFAYLGGLHTYLNRSPDLWVRQ